MEKEQIKEKCQCGTWCDANTTPYQPCPTCGWDREEARKQARERTRQSIAAQIEAGHPGPEWGR